jgi:hypothetical protein
MRMIDEHAVMPALDFRKRVTENLEKILVGRHDGAVHIEFDHRLRPADGCGPRDGVL